MLYAIVVFFGNFLNFKIIFHEMCLKHGIYDNILFSQKTFLQNNEKLPQQNHYLGSLQLILNHKIEKETTMYKLKSDFHLKT
jgi:hypothetical protein